MNKREIKKGSYSQEALVHFRCGSCDKWWSIGDLKKVGRREWFCPWCGVKQKIQKNGR